MHCFDSLVGCIAVVDWGSSWRVRVRRPLLDLGRWWVAPVGLVLHCILSIDSSFRGRLSIVQPRRGLGKSCSVVVGG